MHKERGEDGGKISAGAQGSIRRWGYENTGFRFTGGLEFFYPKLEMFSRPLSLTKTMDSVINGKVIHYLFLSFPYQNVFHVDIVVLNTTVGDKLQSLEHVSSELTKQSGI